MSQDTVTLTSADVVVLTLADTGRAEAEAALRALEERLAEMEATNIARSEAVAEIKRDQREAAKLESALITKRAALHQAIYHPDQVVALGTTPKAVAASVIELLRPVAKALLVAALLILSPLAWAQTCPAAQFASGGACYSLQTVKTAITNDSALNAYPNNADGNFAIAACLIKATNAACDSPGPGAGTAFVVWKTRVQVDVIGDAINSAELAGLSSLNATRLQTLVQLSGAGVNPSIANRRAFFDDIFSGAGGVNTRAALLILWKRNATRIEKAFAQGAGSDASPATLTFEGSIPSQIVEQARLLP